jgi:hypothetical protein
MLMNILYRGLAKIDYTDNVIMPLNTKRFPTNIPYIIDNVWEWLRPDDMPSRRFSTYASPHKELAKKYANDSSVICTVSFINRYQAVQIIDYEDAKLHPDIKLIAKIINEELSNSWFNSDIKNKFGFPLYLPSLDKEEVAFVLNEFPLIKERIISESTFWKSVFNINDLDKLTSGEVFFHAIDGYTIKKDDI